MKKKKRYANAKDVLPKDLFSEVQKYYTGILWIPAPTRFRQARRDLVLALHLQGVIRQEISNLAGVTIRRVNQIIASDRKQHKPRQIDASSGK
jgi:hypothetical protein